MDPFEAILRKQLELALKERSAAAMKKIIDVAIEYKLITKPPKTIEGGVLMVPIVTKADLELWDRCRREPTAVETGDADERSRKGSGEHSR